MLNRVNRVRREQPDAGLTLIEVLVSTTLAVVVGAIGTALTVNTLQQVNETSVSSQTDDGARLGINQIASEVRLADSPNSLSDSSNGRFVAFDQWSMTFYSDRDAASRVGSLTRTAPSRVTIGRETDADDSTISNVVMRVWKPGVDPSGAPSEKRTLIRNLQNKIAKPLEPLFTYCSSAQDPPQPTSAPSPDADPSPQCRSVTYSSATSNVPLSLRASQISSVIVSARVVGGEVEATGGRRLPTTWLTTRVAVTGVVAPFDVKALP